MNEAELEDFWLAYRRYKKGAKVGKQNKSAKEAPEIVFQNLRETSAVSLQLSNMKQTN